MNKICYFSLAFFAILSACNRAANSPHKYLDTSPGARNKLVIPDSFSIENASMPMEYLESLMIPGDLIDSDNEMNQFLVFVKNAEKKNIEMFGNDYLIKMSCDVVQIVMSNDANLKGKEVDGSGKLYFSDVANSATSILAKNGYIEK